MGWANNELNRYLAAVHDARRFWREGQRYPAVKRIVKTWAVLGAAAALGQLIVGKGPEDEDEDKELSAAEWARWYVTLTLVGPLSRLPYVSSVVKSVSSGRDASLTPWLRPVEEGAKAAIGAYRAVGVLAEGDTDKAGEMMSRAALQGLNVAGYLAGAPMSQLRATGGYLSEGKGGAPSEAETDWASGNYVGVGLGTVFGKARKGTLKAVLEGE
jgi:hypothetical protein